MNNRTKNIYFDFCETLVSFQTADAFVDFARLNARKSTFRLIWESLFKFFKRIKLFSFLEYLFPQKSIEKKFKLFQLKGLTIKELEEISFQYYHTVIKKHFIPEIYNEFLSDYELNYNITVVSGGYDIYLNCFIEDFPKCNLISTKLKFDNDTFSGKLIGKDCLYGEKVVQLEKLNFSQENSIVYTDSYTDLPLLKWCKQGVVVSKNKHQAWSSKNGFKEIVWQN